MCWVDEDEGPLQDLLAYIEDYTCIFNGLLVTIYLQQNGLRRIETGYLGNNWLFTVTPYRYLNCTFQKISISTRNGSC